MKPFPRRISDARIGAGIAGLLLLGIAAIDFFAAAAPAGASFLTALTGGTLLAAAASGLAQQ